MKEGASNCVKRHSIVTLSLYGAKLKWAISVVSSPRLRNTLRSE